MRCSSNNHQAHHISLEPHNNDMHMENKTWLYGCLKFKNGEDLPSNRMENVHGDNCLEWVGSVVEIPYQWLTSSDNPFPFY